MVSDPIPDPGLEPAAEPIAGGSPLLVPDSSPAPRAMPKLPELPEAPTLPADEIARIVGSRHDAPYRVLGPHVAADGRGVIVRTFLPEAVAVILRIAGEGPAQQEMRRIHPDGLFECRCAGAVEGITYEFLVRWGDAAPVAIADAYRFAPPDFSEEDDALFAAGRHARLFDRFGARPAVRDGVAGVAFGVWAPNAIRVSVVGPFNNWDGRRHPMQRTGGRGVWQMFVPGAGAGDFYKFEIKTQAGAVFLKSDPFATDSEPPPHRASIVTNLAGRRWRDDAWTGAGRAATLRARGMRPYLVSPETAADAAARAAAAAGCGLVEPVMPGPVAAPFGLFACPPGFASPDALASWVETCHAHDVGVLLAAPDETFPETAAELALFDGTRLYERDGDDAAAPLRFDLQKGEVRSLLLSAAQFRLERWHVDALAGDSATVRRLADLPAATLFGPAAASLIVRDPMPAPSLSDREIRRIAAGWHDDPFAVLGVHPAPRAATPSAPPMLPGGLV
ncbi:MAG TPA: hypothetical protein VES39_01105, partial [Rhodospirillales bacterium]|nr:hypothetical protein [Rhodospirillales bacterium]